MIWNDGKNLKLHQIQNIWRFCVVHGKWLSMPDAKQVSHTCSILYLKKSSERRLQNPQRIHTHQEVSRYLSKTQSINDVGTSPKDGFILI